MTKWKLVPVEPTPEMYSASRLTTESEGIVTTTWLRSAVYRAMLEAAPQPPKLSDERILSIGKKFLDRGEYPFEGLQPWVYSFARAIEREILGIEQEQSE